MPMNYDHVCVRCQTEEGAFNLAVELGLINLNQKFCVCSSKMNLEKGKKRHNIDLRWRCGNSLCRKTKLVFQGTVFNGAHIKISELFKMLYLHCLEVSVADITNEINVNEKTVYKTLNKLKGLELINENSTGVLLGGLDEVVEVDETHIVSIRDDRGRINTFERYWVIGAFQRSTGKIALSVVRKRNANVCELFVRRTIRAGSTVMTDFWRGYNRLSLMGYIHKKVNHKKEFVDADDPNIHTQHIERLWRKFKENIFGYNTLEQIQAYTKRFEFIHNSQSKTASEKFLLILSINRSN